MILLLVFAFFAGIVTILSPCILPILPIILSSSIDSSGKKRPLGIVTGFIISFTFFTLFLSIIVNALGISSELLRNLSIIVLALFGFSLFVPSLQLFMEKFFSKFASVAPDTSSQKGFGGGIIIGLSLGLLWTPCVGPILASVISLAISGEVTFSAMLITLAYSLGTAIPMYAIMYFGNTIFQKISWLKKSSGKIQKVFGVIMVIVSIGIFFNIDRQFQTYIVKTFPQYGVGLTKFEDTASVKKELDRINNVQENNIVIGQPMPSIALPKGPIAPELVLGGEWINSQPLTLKQLRGNVVIIDFWTYSCINCQRTVPYLKQWYEKYHDQGLEIIGVHSPEFEFEKEVKNVSQAIRTFGIRYPVMQDNNFATWRAYSNRYWPAKYIVDKDGRVRYTHFGEGEYDKSEQVIQELLKEIKDIPESTIDNMPAQRNYAKTPELYLGYERSMGLTSPEWIGKNKIQNYSFPAILKENTFAFKGEWLVTAEYANPQKGAVLELNFDAKEVYLVMNTKGKDSRVKVLVDGKPEYFGSDVQDGYITVDADTLYKIVLLDESGRHTVTFEFEDSDVEIYAFTFG